MTLPAALAPFLPIAVTLLAAGLLALVGVAVRKLHLEARSEKFRLVVNRLSLAVTTIVHDLEATTKAELLKSKGVLDTGAIQRLRDAALSRLKLTLGTEGLKAVMDAVGIMAPALDGFLAGLIESRVSILSGEELDARSAPASVIAARP